MHWRVGQTVNVKDRNEMQYCAVNGPKSLFVMRSRSQASKNCRSKFLTVGKTTTCASSDASLAGQIIFSCGVWAGCVASSGHTESG